LTLPTPDVQTNETHQDSPAVSTVSIVASKTTERCAGERAPERDPVGETLSKQTKQVIGCSFSGVIALLPNQMEASRSLT
jgi:hypothetical protein